MFHSTIIINCCYSILCRKARGQYPVAKASTPHILDADAFRTFWISWSGGKISVGEGIDIGQQTFMSFADPKPVNVNYISVSAWNKPGVFLIDKSNFFDLFEQATCLKN